MVNWSCRPPFNAFGDALKTRHVKDAPEPDVELLQGHWCSEEFVCLGDDDVNYKLLKETHSEEVKLVHLGNVFPMMGVKLPFGVVDVGYPSRAHHGLFEPPIVWTLHDRFSIFGC